MKAKVFTVIFLVLVMSLSGCGTDATGLTNSTTKDADHQSTELPEETPAATTNTDLQTDYADLMELPAGYSEDMAIRDGVVVDKISSVLNPEYLYRFCDLYSDGSEAFVRVMSYTIEGDPIITDVSYNDGIITMTTDSSRDRYTVEEDRLIKNQFRYLVAHDGLLYLSKNPHWKDNTREEDYCLFANINKKAVWKDHLSKFLE